MRKTGAERFGWRTKARSRASSVTSSQSSRNILCHRFDWDRKRQSSPKAIIWKISSGVFLSLTQNLMADRWSRDRSIFTLTRSHYSGSQNHACTHSQSSRRRLARRSLGNLDPTTPPSYSNRSGRSATYSRVGKKCDALHLGQTLYVYLYIYITTYCATLICRDNFGTKFERTMRDRRLDANIRKSPVNTIIFDSCRTNIISNILNRKSVY